MAIDGEFIEVGKIIKINKCYVYIYQMEVEWDYDYYNGIVIGYDIKEIVPRCVGTTLIKMTKDWIIKNMG